MAKRGYGLAKSLLSAFIPHTKKTTYRGRGSRRMTGKKGWSR